MTDTLVHHLRDGSGDPTAELDSELLAAATRCGPRLARNAARYDSEGTWAAESFDVVKEAGLLSIAVPIELGGRGASIATVARVQRELARWCGSTALASSMHQHVTSFLAWRYRRGLPGAEAALRRVAADGIVLASTGGGDFTEPAGVARRVDGGFVVSGRKRFVSQSPVATVMSTMFTLDDPERGRRVLNMSVPVADPGVQVLDTWDAHGMRGTASNDVELTEVFVPDERVLADRPHGVIDPPLQVILSVAFPIISAVYLGVADGAYNAALAHAAARHGDPLTVRRIGLMRHLLQVAGWTLDGALRLVGDDPVPSMEAVAAVMAAKREISLTSVEVADLAAEVAGGPGYARGSAIERAIRDVRAAKLHPFDPERTLLHGGRLALGLDCDRPADWTTA